MKQRPQGGRDAVAASWTMNGEEDGLALYRRACRVTGLDLRTLPVCGPACVGRAPRPEAVADAGPAAPQAPELTLGALVAYGTAIWA